MFISNSHKFIFIHITKAAGTSITAALEKTLSWDDLVLGSTPLGVDIQKHYLTRFNLQKHSKAIEVREVIGKDLWEDYFTFSFVRHPYSRVLSLYTYIQNQVLGKGWKRYLRAIPGTKMNRDPIWEWPATKAYVETDSFSDFIRHPSLVWEPGMKPQAEWLVDKAGKLMLDYIGRVESIEKDFNTVLEKVKLNPLQLEVLNRSKTDKTRLPVIKDEDYRYLEELFKDDFQLLGYDPGFRIKN